MHYFGKSLARGQQGEELFHMKYPELTRTSGRKGDFTHPVTGLIELKSDFYSNPKNFFIETQVGYEGEEAPRPGGPYQALESNIPWFVYQFMMTKKEFWFKTEELCQWVTENGRLYKSSTVMNKKWAGFGLLIPIPVLSSITHACPINRQNDEGPGPV